MKYAAELTRSFNSATTNMAVGAAVLTWLFSAMQCNKEYCFTVDNPIAQVAAATVLAVGTVIVATSAPVLKVVTPYTNPITQRVTRATDYLSNLFTATKKKPDTTQTVPITVIEAQPLNQSEAPRTPIQRELFSPIHSNSTERNTSEPPSTPHSSPASSPSHSHTP